MLIGIDSKLIFLIIKLSILNILISLLNLRFCVFNTNLAFTNLIYFLVFYIISIVRLLDFNQIEINWYIGKANYLRLIIIKSQLFKIKFFSLIMLAVHDYVLWVSVWCCKREIFFVYYLFNTVNTIIHIKFINDVIWKTVTALTLIVNLNTT